MAFCASSSEPISTKANPRAVLIALGLLAGIALLYLVRRPREVGEEALANPEGS